MEFRMDKNNYRYRLCKYCNNEFMAHNISMVFCGDYCADTFYNHFRRGKKNVIQFGDEFINEEELVWGDEEEGLGSYVDDPASERNKSILENLKYDKNNEVLIPAHLLKALGFDFDYYGMRIGRKDKKGRQIDYFYSFGNFSWVFINREICRLEDNTELFNKPNS